VVLIVKGVAQLVGSYLKDLGLNPTATGELTRLPSGAGHIGDTWGRDNCQRETSNKKHVIADSNRQPGGL